MSKNAGGPAFPTMYPVPIVNGAGETIREEFPHPDGQQEGMSLRDWFAEQAPPVPSWWIATVPASTKSMQVWTSWAYAYADAMIAERERRKEES